MANHTILGVEGGGTKTDWVLLDDTGRVLGEGQLGAANLKLSTDEYLAQLFAALPRETTEVGVFLAGCLSENDHARLRRLTAAAWPSARVSVGSDCESGFAAALGDGDGIVVISGTGAVVHGRKGGRVEKSGGWGHILGDRGGGYDMCRHALRKTILHYDIEGTLSPLASAILAELSLNELPQLVDWVNQADKMQVARLAPVIFRAADAGDVEMRELIEHRARDLAQFTVSVAQRLGMERVEVRLLGGLLTKEPGYAAHYRRLLAEKLPGANVELCTRSGAFGAAALASAETVSVKNAGGVLTGLETTKELAGATTEQVHPCAGKLEKMTTGELVALFVEEEDRVRAALAACKDRLAEAVELIATALSNGGRLFYAGAGTSGRLGVLDASEMPPTFCTPSDLVQGVIAGGVAALTQSVETAEDSREAGALAMAGRGVRAGDVVCGIAASGRTPFVLGALARARELGARTIFLTCNPSRNASPQPWDVEIDLPTGAEIVTGSTRLKAGTATKVALNILSTCAMIRLGKVRGGAMVNLRATNVKLRDRATRMVAVALGLDTNAAHELLVANHWDVVAALCHRPPGK